MVLKKNRSLKGPVFLSYILHEFDAFHRAVLYTFAATVAECVVDPGNVVMQGDGFLLTFPDTSSAGDAAGLALLPGVHALFMVGAHDGRPGLAQRRIEINDLFRTDILAGAAARTFILIDHGNTVLDTDCIKLAYPYAVPEAEAAEGAGAVSVIYGVTGRAGRYSIVFKAL